MDFPILPGDVERLIVETTAEVSQEAAVELVRVCRVYRRWAMPAMYKVVTLKSTEQAKKFLETLLQASSKSASPALPLPLAEYIKVLNFSNDIDIGTVSSIVPLCTHAVTVGYWRVRSKFIPGPQLDISKCPSLRRLSLDLSHLSSTNDLARITHLDICSPVLSAWYSLLPQLTSLTHLFICEDFLSNIPDRLEALLPHLPPSIRVFAIHVTSTPESESFPAAKAVLLGKVDVRVVVVSESEWVMPGIDNTDGTSILCRPFNNLLSDWCHTPVGGMDVWELAEALIERRRKRDATRAQVAPCGA
ncbi:hypothetical protein HGRIS_010668 [Hohenbuehelia grisea]|uniref:F-box domain-containing protein n=1 Tax=Hohenbuehelia grisea TaxID=104357 RepID=A0ABR3IXQ1_9AGAR